MRNRRGFTLAELVLAVLIFSYMAASLSTIYATTNRHMFQNYRQNVVKTNVLVSMKNIQNTLSMATRIDFPTKTGAGTDQGNQLAFATNVDQMTGCYPANPGAQAVSPASWHYFCVGADPAIPGSSALYYHTDVLPVGAASCGDTAAPIFTIASYPNSCGAGGGGTVTKLMQHASPGPLPITTFFSRRANEGIYENNTVRVTLRSFWSASGRNLGSAQRDVDFYLDSVVAVNRAR